MKYPSLIFFAILLLIAYIPYRSNAQTETTLSTIVQSISSVYEDLDGPYVHTGYLRDKAVDLIKFPAHTGVALTDSNYVDAFLFRDLFRTMNYARASSAASQYNPDSIFSALTNSVNGYVKLQTALFKYNFIVENAIEDSLLTYHLSTGKVSYKEVSGVIQNPYDSTYVFMLSAGQSIHEGSLVFFYLSDLAPIGNCSVSGLEIDFDDGGGFISTGNSQVKIISYTSLGKKDVKARVTLQDNTVLLSHTYLQLYNATQTTPLSGGELEMVQPDDSFTVSYNGISAKCTYKISASHDGHAKKPFIYVEGFDHPVLAALTNGNIQQLYGSPTGGNYDYYSVYSSNLSATLNNNNYDFFYVNWNNPEADIKQNAILLDRIITQINILRPADGSDERSVLVGHSMGGLIARWALVQMENDHREHLVGCFVCQDSPHLGAVVPIGAQYALRDIYRCLFGADGNSGFSNCQKLKTAFDNIVGVMDCTSARQMMYNYIDSSSSLNNSIHNQWQYDLNEIGFPKGDYGYPIDNLTIVSGGDLGSSELSESIFSSTLSLTSLVQQLIQMSFSNFTVTLKIDRDRGPGTEVAKIVIFYTHLSNVSISPKVFVIKESSHESSVATGAYDIVRGSFLGADDMTNFVIPIPSLFFSIFGNCKIVFVPTASAFALINGYNSDLYTYPPTPEYNKFVSYCLEEDPMRHDKSLNSYIDWIIKYAKLKLNGPEGLILDGDSFSLSNSPSSLGFSWSSSDESVATINNSGSVSISSPGYVIRLDCSATEIHPKQYWHYFQTLIGQDSTLVIHRQKRLYRKTRTALAGFPSMNLSAVRQSGDTYIITATCASVSNSLRSFVDTLAAHGNLRFIWGYKNSDNSYTWTDTTSTRSHVCTALPNALTHVCMKLYNAPERESAEISCVDIDRRATNPFFTEPGLLTVSSLGNMYDYYRLIYTTASTNHYFGVWYNSDYTPAPSTPDNIKIGNETFNLKTSFIKSLDGESKTVYCFEFMQSTMIQEAISNINADIGLNCYFIPIQIRHGTTVLQTTTFYVEKMAIINL